MEIFNPQFISLPLATLIGGLIAYVSLRVNHSVEVNKRKRDEEELMKSKVKRMDF